MWNGINRRKFPRAEYPCKIEVKRKDHPEAVSTQTENIGIGGICVILPKDLGIFAPVEIQLDLLDNQDVVQCAGTVVWIVEKKQGRASFDTGIEFTNLKRKDAIRINDIIEKIVEKNGDAGKNGK